MKLKNGKIVIELSDFIGDLSEDELREIFEMGIVEGFFDDLIDDLLEGEVFGDSYLVKHEVSFGGLEVDYLNELRKKIVTNLTELEAASFDFEHKLYLRSQKKLALEEKNNYELKNEKKILERKVKYLKSKIDEFIGNECESVIIERD